MISLKKNCNKSEKHYLKTLLFIKYFMKIGFGVINFLKFYNSKPVNDTIIIKCC